MKTIDHVPFAPGGYSFKRATTDGKGNRKEAYYVWDFTLNLRHATDAMAPLSHLQKSATICTLKTPTDEWQGMCSVEEFKMVPNKLKGQPSIMKGKLNLYGTPDVLESFAHFMIAINRHDYDEVDTEIRPTQEELPGLEPKDGK